MKRIPPCECRNPVFGGVKDSRRWRSGITVRRRVCETCRRRFRTYELTEGQFYSLVRKINEDLLRKIAELPLQTESKVHDIGYWLGHLGDSRL